MKTEGDPGPNLLLKFPQIAINKFKMSKKKKKNSLRMGTSPEDF